MKKNVTMAVIVFLIIIVGMLSFLIFNGQNTDTPSLIANVDSSKIRLEIKTYIDELYNYDVSSIEHLTDGIEKDRKRLPDAPKIFEAGNYKVVFAKNNEKKVVIFQTEEKVSHISRVIPGETNIGGYVLIQKNPDGAVIDEEKLNDSELDYLTRMLYKKFEKPMVDTQANYLNSVKDYTLAIMFSEKNGINEYHNQLINELKK